MRKNQQLVIVLPESSEELPIRIVRGSRSMELRLCLCPPDGEERHINETCPERKYVFIWRQNDYLKTAVDETRSGGLQITPKHRENKKPTDYK